MSPAIQNEQERLKQKKNRKRKDSEQLQTPDSACAEDTVAREEGKITKKRKKDKGATREKKRHKRNHVGEEDPLIGSSESFERLSDAHENQIDKVKEKKRKRRDSMQRDKPSEAERQLPRTPSSAKEDDLDHKVPSAVQENIHKPPKRHGKEKKKRSKSTRTEGRDTPLAASPQKPKLPESEGRADEQEAVSPKEGKSDPKPMPAVEEEANGKMKKRNAKDKKRRHSKSVDEPNNTPAVSLEKQPKLDATEDAPENDAKASETYSKREAQDGEMASSPSPKRTKTTPSDASNPPDDDDTPLDDERLPRTLFVGNVPQTATRKDLRKVFSQYSPIESIRIRNVIPVNPKIPKRVALLANRLARFSNSFSAYVVLKQSPDIEVLLKRAVDGTNMTIFQEHHLRVSKALQTKGARRQSVFVGNLPFDCSDEELITAFMPIAEECGVKLMNVRVNRDTDTGVGRGVGFVTFDDIMGIQACLNKSGEIKIRGRVVRVERAFKTKNMKSKSYKKKRKMAFGRNQS